MKNTRDRLILLSHTLGMKVDAKWLDAQIETTPDVNNRVVADLLGIDPSAVSRMRGNSGGRKISADEAAKLLHFFGASKVKPEPHSEPLAQTRLAVLEPAEVGTTDGGRVYARLPTDGGIVEVLLTGAQALHLAKHLERAEGQLPLAISSSVSQSPHSN